MTTVQEATNIILQNLYTPQPVASLITDSVGHVLAEDIVADRDFPPFDRVTMDGIAVSYDSISDGAKTMKMEGTQAAGQPALELQDPDKCIEVMTGAVLPVNTDTVIPYEYLVINGDEVTLSSHNIKRFQHIHRTGTDARTGDVLVKRGSKISPAEVALMATVGLKHIDTLSFPSAAIVATGNELVDVDQVPQPHQIRQSNSYALHAAMKALNWPVVRYHIPDNPDFARDSLQAILANHEVIILSGGVSKGKFDYIPSTLKDLGVTNLINGVAQRPGKPFWFGKTKDNKTVFALPGNPVSTFLCFYRYVEPWLKESFGLRVTRPQVFLAEDFTFAASLAYFLQVRVVNEGGNLRAHPVPGGGSGDFVNLNTVDGFIELEANRSIFKAGETFEFIPFRHP